MPQAGQSGHPGCEDPERRRLVVSLAVVDPVTGERWLLDASPDFPRQLHRLDRAAPVEGPPPGLDGCSGLRPDALTGWPDVNVLESIGRC